MKKQNNVAEKCTIFIPTYNRSDRLKRLLEYYEQEGRFNVIIGDSSSDINKKKNKETTGSFSNLNIKHNIYPVDVKPYYYYKFSDCLNQVDTEFSVLCADDDFVTPNGINASVEFLEKNSDFICCQGRSLTFYVEKDEKNNKNFYWFKGGTYKSITSDTSIDRLLSHFSNYTSTLYAVHKTDMINMIFKENMKYTNDDRFGEILPSMLTLIYGKIKYLDVFYHFREYLIDSGGRTSKRIQDFISEGTYNEKYSRFKECLSKHLSDANKISVEEAEKIVDKGWNEYIKKHKGYKIPKINYMMKKMSLPPFVDENLRRIYKKVSNRKKQIYMPDFVISHDLQVEKDEEFKRIKRNVLSHYKNEL